ncbi:MAG: hemerythrin domain-containing protein [Lacunisphaera sp.]
MTAIEEMSAEHRVIARVIHSLPEAVAALDQGRRLNVATLRGVAEFLRVYADQRHHQREEGIFFPLLVQRGVPPEGCPIGGLNNEHGKGRVLVAALVEAITGHEQQRAGADAALRQVLQDLVTLYQKHLWMEDAMVFPMAEKLVTAADHEALNKQFADLDRTIGADVVARWEQFAASLSFQAEGPIAAL